MPEPIIAGTPPSPQHVAVVTALARHLIDHMGLVQLPHAVKLDGMVSAYASLLVQHPCCWEETAGGLRELANRLDAMRLAQAAAADQAAQDAIAAAMRPAA